MERLSVIKVIIVSRNMSLSQAAECTGISQGYISEVIQGKKNMKYETLMRFLEKMEYTYGQYERLERYSEELEKTEMKYSDKWSRLLKCALSYLLKDKDIIQDNHVAQNRTSRI